MALYAHICWLFAPVLLYLSEIITVFWSWPCRALWGISPAESLHWSIGIWQARTCRRSLLKVRVDITFILAKCALWLHLRAKRGIVLYSSSSRKLDNTLSRIISKNYQQLFSRYQPPETGSKGAGLFSAVSANSPSSGCGREGMVKVWFAMFFLLSCAWNSGASVVFLPGQLKLLSVLLQGAEHDCTNCTYLNFYHLYSSFEWHYILKTETCLNTAQNQPDIDHYWFYIEHSRNSN